MIFDEFFHKKITTRAVVVVILSLLPNKNRNAVLKREYGYFRGFYLSETVMNHQSKKGKVTMTNWEPDRVGFLPNSECDDGATS